MRTASHTLPKTMSCVEISAPGGPEVLRLAQRDLPQPGVGEVLIKVAAAGVNRPDVAQRQGLYPPPPGASDLPGLEVAGEVVAVAEGVSQWRVGDSVCALTNGGGYAAYVTAPQGQCLPIPEGLDYLAAASLPETFFTVWSNLYDRAGLQAGESLLVHGGSSGIGVTAIQMAKALGSRVYATAGSEEKCRACEALGAERAVNYRSEDFVAVLQELTENRGMDVILDMVGGDYLNRNLSVAAMDGRVVNIAFLQGHKAEINLAMVLLKRLSLTGSMLRPQSAAAKAAIATQLLEHVWPLIAAGRIKPVIHQHFPLAEATAAHSLMESSAHIGKIVLTV